MNRRNLLVSILALGAGIATDVDNGTYMHYIIEDMMDKTAIHLQDENDLNKYYVSRDAFIQVYHLHYDLMRDATFHPIGDYPFSGVELRLQNGDVLSRRTW